MFDVEKAIGGLRGAIEMSTAETAKLRADVARLAVKVHRLNATVRQLHCMDPDTNPACPMDLADEDGLSRESLQSIDQEDDDSVLRLAIETVRAVREARAKPPARLSFFGLALSGRAPLIAVASVFVALGVAIATGHLQLHW